MPARLLFLFLVNFCSVSILLSESLPCLMSPDTGTCRDDGFNHGAAAMNSRNATDLGRCLRSCQIWVRIVEGLLSLRRECNWSHGPVRCRCPLVYYLQVLADTWSVLLSLGTSKAKMFVLYSKEFLHMDSFVLRAIFFLPLSLCP